jgi:hypothetical protein
MLPPVLELYIVWHPGDPKGAAIAQELVEHFHGTAFTGLIGGAIEVFVRTEGWRSAEDAPRPIPSPKSPLPNGLEQAQFAAIVPLMGTEMAAVIEGGARPWRDYIENIVRLQSEMPERFGLFPYLMDHGAGDNTVLGKLLECYQRIALSAPHADEESEGTLRCRDLAQGIAQILSREADKRLTVFISHTKHNLPGDHEDTAALIAMVREVIANTHLRQFFDASDLQPGSDWDAELRSKAATSALLGIRTDLYPSREWCQREILIAKRRGMPVIIMDAPGIGEERGSFLMDHVPRIPVRVDQGRWNKQDVFRALNLLVDECLKRVLWFHQESLARGRRELEIAWWAPHAPEPLTLVQWLEDSRRAGTLPLDGLDVRILHPDPPLGEDEKAVLQQLLSISHSHSKLDIMTPRLLAARGG